MSFLSLLKRRLTRSVMTLGRPVFIWGTGRSGTHLLYDILSLHPELETKRVKSRWKKGLWGDAHHGDSTPPQLRGKPIPVEGHTAIWAPAGAPAVIYETVSGGDRNIDADMVRHAYLDLDRRYFLDNRPAVVRRVLDKCPLYILMVEAINNIFPDSYHIFCVRDPRIVVNSILRLMRVTSPDAAGREYGDGFFAKMYPHGYDKMLGRPLIEALTWQIGTLLEVGLRYRNILGDRLIVVRHEETIASPREVGSSLFDQIGLDPSRAALDVLIPDSFPDYAPEWPVVQNDCRADKGIFFDASEWPVVDGLRDVAEKFGYCGDRPGEICGPITMP